MCVDSLLFRFFSFGLLRLRCDFTLALDSVLEYVVGLYLKKELPHSCVLTQERGKFNIISFLTESHQLLVSKRNSEVTLLASWVNTLNVENWILTG